MKGRPTTCGRSLFGRKRAHWKHMSWVSPCSFFFPPTKLLLSLCVSLHHHHHHLGTYRLQSRCALHLHPQSTRSLDTMFSLHRAGIFVSEFCIARMHGSALPLPLPTLSHPAWLGWIWVCMRFLGGFFFLAPASDLPDCFLCFLVLVGVFVLLAALYFVRPLFAHTHTYTNTHTQTHLRWCRALI
jgi:hypothetical protein